jgi:hypothetical protein
MTVLLNTRALSTMVLLPAALLCSLAAAQTPATTPATTTPPVTTAPHVRVPLKLPTTQKTPAPAPQKTTAPVSTASPNGTAALASNGRAPLTTSSASSPSATSSYSRAPLTSPATTPSTASSSGPGTSNTTTTTNGAPRSQLNTSSDGIGSFPGCCGYNLIAYSCFRAGASVLCDFDVTNQGNVQANAKAIYNDLRIVGSGGRIFGHNQAYFVDTDGSQFQTSYISAGSRVRMVMQFENVPASYSTVSLVQGRNNIQNVTIYSQEPGTSSQQTPNSKR